MRPAIKKGPPLLGACALLAASLPFMATAQTGSLNAGFSRCVATATGAATPKLMLPQVQHDARTNATFFFSSIGGGAVRMTVTAADLEVEKIVYPGGRSRIVLQAGSDRVSVTIGVGVVNVERRGAGRLQLDIGRATETEWLQAKALLAGSKAVGLLRALADNLDERSLKGAGGAAIVLSDALIGHLDGDVAAVGRLLSKMRASLKARIRPAALSEEEEGGKCWHTYEVAVTHAADDYNACRRMFSWYDPRQAACAFVWSVQAEVAWAELLACSSIPLKITT